MKLAFDTKVTSKGKSSNQVKERIDQDFFANKGVKLFLDRCTCEKEIKLK